MKPLKNKTDWFLYSTVLLIIICIQGSLQHSERRELFDDFRSMQESRMEVKDRRASWESALNVPQYIQDVRADSRRSRIDAQDIRTDFREIRTELGGRLDAKEYRRMTASFTPRSDLKARSQEDRRERQSERSRQQRFVSLDNLRRHVNWMERTRQSQERVDSRDALFSRRLTAEKTSQERSSGQERTNSQRESLDRQTRERVNSHNTLFSRRFNAERFDRRTSQGRSSGPETRLARLNMRENVRHEELPETRKNNQLNRRTSQETRQERLNSRDNIKENNQMRHATERFDRERNFLSKDRKTRRAFHTDRTDRELIETRDQERGRHRSDRQESSDQTRESSERTSINREARTGENLNESRTQQRCSVSESSHRHGDQARVTSMSSERVMEREDVRSKPFRVSEVRYDQERTGNQLSLKNQKGSAIPQTVLPSVLKNKSNIFVSTIQAALVLFLVLQMVGGKSKNQFRYNSWTSRFSHVKSA